MHGEMLWRGDGAQILRVVALHAADERRSHFSGQKGILAIGLLSAPPTRVAKNVQVRSPEIQADRVEDSLANLFVMAGASLGPDRRTHFMNQRSVKGGRQADGLREDGHVAGDHAMQRLRPPLVS